MAFAHWLNRLKKKIGSKPTPIGKPLRCRLSVEQLEERVVPTTYEVTSLDGGNNVSGSLRYILDNQVANGDIVQFQVSGTVSLKGAISVNKNITINGNGQT